MTDAAKKARAEYIRKWRAEHSDKQREYNERYWERKAQRAEEAKDGNTPQR